MGTEFKHLIGIVCPMGDKNSTAFIEIFHEMSKRQRGVEGSADQLDFPEFLWLLKHLHDTNFGNMQERAAIVTSKEPASPGKLRLRPDQGKCKKTFMGLT